MELYPNGVPECTINRPTPSQRPESARFHAALEDAAKLGCHWLQPSETAIQWLQSVTRTGAVFSNEVWDEADSDAKRARIAYLLQLAADCHAAIAHKQYTAEELWAYLASGVTEDTIRSRLEAWTRLAREDRAKYNAKRAQQPPRAARAAGAPRALAQATGTEQHVTPYTPVARPQATEQQCFGDIPLAPIPSSDATRLLKASNWRVNAALDAFFNDPRPTSKAAAANTAQLTKNLDTLWQKYCDPSQPSEIAMDGTMQYCADLDVDPADVVMLALAWFTQAPTMGRFGKQKWVEAWQAIGADSLDKQKQQVDALREQLKTAETFRKVYLFAFDYAKQEGQKSLQFEIAQELWNLLIPLDPASSFPPEHLEMWNTFLSEKGGRAVSKDSWNLFLDFARTIDPAFKQYDEDAAWPSVIDDFVEYARSRA
ncbi:hypothetical protein BMF94_4057 [Rhodotorula taiwanensis]|uniref:Defective in cullin neddylation protein n=1 Tax=Rhodotorula taiwanensis TaxID=741276 RepID=A0A2S5B800_9BASI|nr:hypothetical protein BMF94_4057 [Rhodotorula taiwanensis]